MSFRKMTHSPPGAGKTSDGRDDGGRWTEARKMDADNEGRERKQPFIGKNLLKIGTTVAAMAAMVAVSLAMPQTADAAECPVKMLVNALTPTTANAATMEMTADNEGGAAVQIDLQCGSVAMESSVSRVADSVSEVGVPLTFAMIAEENLKPIVANEGKTTGLEILAVVNQTSDATLTTHEGKGVKVRTIESSAVTRMEADQPLAIPIVTNLEVSRDGSTRI